MAARALVAGLFAVLGLLAGCVAVSHEVSGTPFLGEVADPEQTLRALARQAVRAASLAEMVALLKATSGIESPHQHWEGTVRRERELDVYTWQFAAIRRARVDLAVWDAEDLVMMGYTLKVSFLNGRPYEAVVGTTALPKSIREWLTHKVVSAATATVGTLLILTVR